MARWRWGLILSLHVNLVGAFINPKIVGPRNLRPRPVGRLHISLLDFLGDDFFGLQGLQQPGLRRGVIKPGTWVYIRDLNQPGVVLNIQGDGTYILQVPTKPTPTVSQSITCGGRVL
jgi:hypothetical protein